MSDIRKRILDPFLSFFHFLGRFSFQNRKNLC
nr:MAG TPA: hypothetical protein [Caudoviricetes sp.]